MKRFILIITLMGIFPFAGMTQTKETLNLSLEQAINQGLHRRYDHKADQYQIERAGNQIKEKKNKWIPDLHIEGSARYTFDLKPTVVPDDFADILGSHILSLGSKSTTTLGLSLEQPIFKPGINTDVKIAKAHQALKKEEINGHAISIKNQIAEAYLNVLLKKLQYQISKKEEKRFKKYKVLAQGKYKNGVLLKNTYLRTKLDYENAQIEKQKAKQNYALSQKYLKYQLNLPPKTQVILTDSIDHLEFPKSPFEKGDFSENRTEIKQLKLAQKENELERKRLRQNALPEISLIGYYAQLYQNENFHYNQSLWWAPHSYIGIKVSIPLTGNFSNKTKLKAQKIRKEKLNMDLQQKKADVGYQIEKTSENVHNALRNLQSAKKNYDLSQSIYKNQEQQFSVGVFNYTDLLDTEKSLNTAEQTYVQMVYKFLNAKLDYRKAMGKL